MIYGYREAVTVPPALTTGLTTVKELKNGIKTDVAGYDRQLSWNEIQEKIKKASGHIAHLQSRISSRTSHGGKSHRVRQIHTKEQISEAAQRIEQYKTALNRLEPVIAHHTSRQWRSFVRERSAPEVDLSMSAFF